MDNYIIFLPGMIYILLGVAHLLNYHKRRYFVNKWIQDDDIQKAYFYYLNEDKSQTILSKKDKREIDKLLNRIAGHNWLSYWSAFLITFVTISFFSYVTISFFLKQHGIKLDLGIDLSIMKIFINLKEPVYFAALGAYLWGFYEFLQRYRNQNWSAVAQHMIWLKIPISMLVCYFIFDKSAGEVASIVAFAIGAFPIEYLKKFVMNAAAPKLGTMNKNLISSPKWETINGITEQVVEKFEEQEVENVHQLASADPFRLHFNTNIEFITILDYIDQAILLAYMDEKDVELLKKNGITGAIDLAILYLFRKNEIDAVAKLLKFDGPDNSKPELRERKIFENIMKNIYEDSRVDLIYQLWNINSRKEEQS
jgi:hypothetical protein